MYIVWSECTHERDSEGTREEVGREEFLKRVWAYKEEQGGHITRQLRSLGASADWSRERFTMDKDLSEAVVEAFVRLHEKGLVYRGEYMVNWAPLLQTAVSDLEVDYADEEGKLYYFKYMVEDSDGEFVGSCICNVIIMRDSELTQVLVTIRIPSCRNDSTRNNLWRHGCLCASRGRPLQALGWKECCGTNERRKNNSNHC